MKKLLLFVAITLTFCFSTCSESIYCAESMLSSEEETITVHKEFDTVSRNLEQLRQRTDEQNRQIDLVRKQMQLREFIIDYIMGFKIEEEEATRIANSSISSSNEFDVEPLLIISMIRQECVFDVDLVMKKTKATGAMQILPGTGKRIAAALDEEYSRDKLLDLDTNIRWGTWYLKDNLDRYAKKKNGEFLGIKAYFTGPNAVYNKEHDWYAKSVLNIYKGLQEEYDKFSENVTP